MERRINVGVVKRGNFSTKREEHNFGGHIQGEMLWADDSHSTVNQCSASFWEEKEPPIRSEERLAEEDC